MINDKSWAISSYSKSDWLFGFIWLCICINILLNIFLISNRKSSMSQNQFQKILTLDLEKTIEWISKFENSLPRQEYLCRHFAQLGNESAKKWYNFTKNVTKHSAKSCISEYWKKGNMYWTKGNILGRPVWPAYVRPADDIPFCSIFT